MNISVLHQLIVLIEEVLKSDAHVIECAAVETAEQDPKVQEIAAASTVLLTAAQSLKAVIATPPAAPKA